MFWGSQNRKYTIYGGYSLITLKKLKPAVTNYCKFVRSSLVVSSKTIYGGCSLIILNKLNYQPLQITANLWDHVLRFKQITMNVRDQTACHKLQQMYERPSNFLDGLCLCWSSHSEAIPSSVCLIYIPVEYCTNIRSDKSTSRFGLAYLLLFSFVPHNLCGTHQIRPPKI